MHRILILVAGFMIAVSGLLFLQGRAGRDPQDLVLSNVTDLDRVSALSAATPVVADPNAGALTAAIAAATAPTPAQADPDMDAMTAGVLAGLGMQVEPAPAGAANEMEAMTNSVLAGLGIGQAPSTAPAPAGNDLSSIVAQALRQGQSDAYIDALVNEAATSGAIAVPEALMRADGRVDTNTLLASIVAKATAQTSAYTEALAAEAGATSVAAAPAATPRADTFYVVEPGDSLAFISLQFYGNTSSYTRIFEANRDKISSPNQIRVGQKLRIPG